MVTRVQKWGNSYAVRLPKKIVVHLGLRVGTPVRFDEQKESVVVKKLDDQKPITFKDWKKYLIPMKTKKIVHVSDRVDEILYGKTD